MSPEDIAASLLDEVEAGLDSTGYWAGEAPAGSGPEAFLPALARALGGLYVPEGCVREAPLIATRPTRAAGAAPFDRPEPIGWHGDFASHSDRPELSLVYVVRSDPAGERAGAWRLASVRRVVDRLAASVEGKAAIDLLGRMPLPFSYSEGGQVRWFKLFEARGPEGSLGMRFYEPSILRGCVAVHGEVPPEIESALRLVRSAADEAGELRPTRAGSLLVIDNWRALHDRTEQSVPADVPGREALLAFTATRLRRSGCDTPPRAIPAA